MQKHKFKIMIIIIDFFMEGTVVYGNRLKMRGGKNQPKMAKNIAET
jgi:hypothetical protein